MQNYIFKIIYAKLCMQNYICKIGLHFEPAFRMSLPRIFDVAGGPVFCSLSPPEIRHSQNDPLKGERHEEIAEFLAQICSTK